VLDGPSLASSLNAVWRRRVAQPFATMRVLVARNVDGASGSNEPNRSIYQRRMRVLVHAIGTLLVVIALAFLLRAFNWHQVVLTLREARIWPIIAALVLSFAISFFRGAFLSVILAPSFTLSPWRTFRYAMVCAAASAVFPLRAGDVLRPWLLKRHHDVSIRHSISILGFEKLADVGSLFLLSVPLSFLLTRVPSWVRQSILAVNCVAVVAFIIVGGVLLYVRIHPTAERQYVLAYHNVLVAMLNISVAWLIDLLQIYCVLVALGIHAPPSAGILVLLAINLAITLPAAPANGGTLELGALAALQVVGVAPSAAVAFTLIYHALQVIPTALVGLVDARRWLVHGTSTNSECAS